MSICPIDKLHEAIQLMQKHKELSGIKDMPKQKIQDLIFLLNNLSLDLALWASPNNLSEAMSIYGMANYNSFKKLIAQPKEKLHPNKGIKL
jgi:hypothetical protein